MKKQPELTPWFPKDVKPTRVGVYQTNTAWGHVPGDSYQYWDGRRFRCWDRNPDGAYRDRGFSSRYPQAPWRGLASDPEVSA